MHVTRFLLVTAVGGSSLWAAAAAVCLGERYAMRDGFGCLSSRRGFGRAAVYAIALFALAAPSVAQGKMQSAAHAPAPGRSFRDCAHGCPEMVVVPPGSFMMGAPSGEEERENLPDIVAGTVRLRGRSVPQHLVTIGHKFAIGKFDVTRDEYAQFAAETHRPDSDGCITITASATFVTANGNWRSPPGFQQTGRDPVVCVSWDDAKAYVAWLSAKTGHVYRLPSEAEWEYAARAGTTTARYWSGSPAEICRHTNVGDLEYAKLHPADTGVNRACSDGYAFTSPVGSFPPNQFGLYDMLGDVMDWTEDCWNPNYNGAPADGSAWLAGKCKGRIVHGGSWDADLSVSRAAMRRAILTTDRNATFGFRVARTL